jgi:hypothetical protein
MRRFYATFLVLLVTASVALTALLSAGARMRAGAGGAAAITVAVAGFVALNVASLLLVRIMVVLGRRPLVPNAPEQGGSR